MLEAIRREPERVFTSKECVAIMECQQRRFDSAVKFAVANQALFVMRMRRGQCSLVRGTPFPEGYVHPEPKRSHYALPSKPDPQKPWATDREDPRIGRVVPNWQPPVMRHVRGGQ